MKLSASFLFLFFLMVACHSLPVKTDSASTPPAFTAVPILNVSMQNLKNSLETLEPYIFDKKRFNDPKNKSFLSTEIHKLAIETTEVKHSPAILSKDPTVRFVAVQFADELQRADENFSTGWHEYSRSQLVNVTSYCIECHTRLKDGPEFNSKRSSDSYMKKLAVQDRIELMIAFRQYDPAFNLVLETLKSIHPLSSVEIDAEQIARLGLLIAVQYKQDMTNAMRLSVSVERNKALPVFLQEKSREWKASIAQWKPNENLQTLPAIKKIIHQRKSEIEDMRAIAALLQYLTADLSDNELGEALLLAGESYESLNKISLVTLHENYYESCIYRVPQTKWGKACFNKLNESVTFGYTGSGGTHIPLEIQKRMRDLKRLTE
ncbi:MAG: hypothetical protein H7328_08615 [Bdellovibrio sp.]|nr:hypothetical protein [Bdellovibrio sp.]